MTSGAVGGHGLRSGFCVTLSGMRKFLVFALYRWSGFRHSIYREVDAMHLKDSHDRGEHPVESWGCPDCDESRKLLGGRN